MIRAEHELARLDEDLHPFDESAGIVPPLRQRPEIVEQGLPVGAELTRHRIERVRGIVLADRDEMENPAELRRGVVHGDSYRARVSFARLRYSSTSSSGETGITAPAKPSSQRAKVSSRLTRNTRSSG